VREAADLKDFKHQNLLRKVSFDAAIQRANYWRFTAKESAREAANNSFNLRQVK